MKYTNRIEEFYQMSRNNESINYAEKVITFNDLTVYRINEKGERVLLTKEEREGIDKSWDIRNEFQNLDENKDINLMEDDGWTDEVIERFEKFIESRKEDAFWYHRIIKKHNEFKEYLKNKNSVHKRSLLLPLTRRLNNNSYSVSFLL